MTTTDELDDRMHLVEQDVRQLRGDMTAMRREINARFDRATERFASLEQTIDRRFNEAAVKMERIIEMLGRLSPR